MEAAGLQNLAWTWVRLPDSVHKLYGVVAQLARALDLHSKSRGFESLYLHICQSGGTIVCTTIRRAYSRVVM